MEIVWILGVFVPLVIVGGLVSLSYENGRSEQRRIDESIFNAQRGRWGFRQVAVISFLHDLEQLAYISPGYTIPKDNLAVLLERLSRDMLEEKSEYGKTPQGSSFHRYGDNGSGPTAQQAIVDRVGGVEKRLTTPSPGDFGQ